MKKDLLLSLLLLVAGTYTMSSAESLQVDDPSVALGVMMLLYGALTLLEYFGFHLREKIGSRMMKCIAVIALAWIVWTARTVAGYLIPLILVGALFIGAIRALKK